MRTLLTEPDRGRLFDMEVCHRQRTRKRRRPDFRSACDLQLIANCLPPPHRQCVRCATPHLSACWIKQSGLYRGGMVNDVIGRRRYLQKPAREYPPRFGNRMIHRRRFPHVQEARADRPDDGSRVIRSSSLTELSRYAITRR